MSVESETQRITSFSRVLIWGTLIFLILLLFILGIGLFLSLSDRGEIGIWLRTIRDFLLVGLLLEVTLFVVSAIYFIWRLGHFIEETSGELKAISGDARETAHIAQESLQVLHHHLVQPILFLHALWKELQGLFRAWAGLKQAATEEENISAVQKDTDSN